MLEHVALEGEHADERPIVAHDVVGSAGRHEALAGHALAWLLSHAPSLTPGVRRARLGYPDRRPTRPDRGLGMNGTTINQKFAYALGAIYLIVGLAGFAVTGGVGFASPEGAELIWFEVNPLHNIVHLALGAAWLIGGAAGPLAARSVNMTLGAVLLLLGIAGFFVRPDASYNILALDTADNWLHLLTGVVALGVAMYATRERTEGATSRGRPAAGMG